MATMALQSQFDRRFSRLNGPAWLITKSLGTPAAVQHRCVRTPTKLTGWEQHRKVFTMGFQCCFQNALSDPLVMPTFRSCSVHYLLFLCLLLCLAVLLLCGSGGCLHLTRSCLCLRFSPGLAGCSCRSLLLSLAWGDFISICLGRFHHQGLLRGWCLGRRVTLCVTYGNLCCLLNFWRVTHLIVILCVGVMCCLGRRVTLCVTCGNLCFLLNFWLVTNLIVILCVGVMWCLWPCRHTRLITFLPQHKRLLRVSLRTKQLSSTRGVALISSTNPQDPQRSTPLTGVRVHRLALGSRHGRNVEPLKPLKRWPSRGQIAMQRKKEII